MLQSELSKLEDLRADTCSVQYQKVPDGEAWRVGFVKEMLEIKLGELEVAGFENEELQEILEVVCTS